MEEKKLQKNELIRYLKNCISAEANSCKNCPLFKQRHCIDKLLQQAVDYLEAVAYQD